MQHWPNGHIFEVMANIKIGNFTADELERFLRKRKNDKSPGPDGIPM